MIHSASRHRRQLNLHSRLKTVRDSLHGRVIKRVLWPLHSPDLTTRDFYLWGSWRGFKTENQHTLEELKYNVRREISTISGEELQIVNNV